jgi:chromosome segregation ATPase
MKTKLGVAILAVACVGLIIFLVVTQKRAAEEKERASNIILQFSNDLVTVNLNLNEMRQVNLVVSNDLAASREINSALSNNVAEASTSLTNLTSQLQSAQDQITNLNTRISSLESQNQILDQHAASLASLITNLNAEIADTQHKLADAVTNNVFLEKELQEQMAQKAELEAKFNDLTVVRGQVKKLHDELVTARRVQWIRSGTSTSSSVKGAQLLMQRSANTAPARPEHYDLNVEVGSDGSVRVVPAPTNAPAMTNPPAQ